MRHYFEDFFHWLDQIPDWREPKRMRYRVRELIGTGLMLFLLRLESRRQLNEKWGPFDTNASRFFHGQRIAHGDSVNSFLRRLEALHKVRVKMVRHLLRQKVVDRFRVHGYVIVVVDGTGTIPFRQRHCASCVTRKLSNRETLYHHPMLEAKLVSANGLVVSLGSEFERNDDGQDKQDGEVKAFSRLAQKRDFPPWQICLVADGLYAGAPTLALCEALGWKYVIVLRNAVLPTVWQWVRTRRPFTTRNRRTLQQRPDGTWVREQCWWATGIDDHGQTVQVLEL